MTKTIQERLWAAYREGKIRRELQAEKQAEIERLKAEQARNPVAITCSPAVAAHLQWLEADAARREALFADIKAQAAAREAKKSTNTYRGALRFR
jgi:hypothetical protein